MRKAGQRVLPAVVVALTLGIGILIGTVVSRGVRAAKNSPVAADAKLLPMPSPAEMSNSFAAIADKIADTVVNINAETTVRVSRRRPTRPRIHPSTTSSIASFRATPIPRRRRQ